MPKPLTSIEKHYTTDNLLERIFGALVMSGKDPYALTVDDLAAVDAFHTRGRNSTIELAELATPRSTDHVIDVGCGLGGSARFLANTFGCRVTGIDLTAEYVKVATKLTELVKLDHKVNFLVESAAQLSADDNSCDVVWTEHAQMNIHDKNQLYREIARVLKPGGRFVFNDIFAGDPKQQPTFPLPWAERSGLSFLCTLSDALHMIRSAGFHVEKTLDKTDESTIAFEKANGKLNSGDPPPLGIHLLMGETALEKVANYLTSIRDGAITVAMGVAVKQNASGS